MLAPESVAPRNVSYPVLPSEASDNPPEDPGRTPPHLPPSGGSLTQLDPVEINDGSTPHSPSQDVSYRHSLCETFRHSGWHKRRVATKAALRLAGASDATIERFASCGCRAWVMRAADDSGRVRLSLNRCRSRWCTPCATEKRTTIQVNVKDACEGKELRFLTLTLRSVDAPLGQQISRLRRYFRRLRNRRDFAPRMRGGVYFLEITLNEKTGLWHPHLHVLYEGSFIAKNHLSETWHAITGDSYIVDIRGVPNSAVAAGYIAKYAGKPVSDSVVWNTERLVELMEAMSGARTFHVFGCWRELDLSKPPADDTEWIPMAPLASVILKAQDGDGDARQVLAKLRRSNADEPLDSDHPP